MARTLRLHKTGSTLVLVVPDPGGELASLTLTNASASATPATTYYPFGHPFAQGDVPAGSRLAATWDGSSAPVQVSGRSSWPDGSLRFARVAVKLPAVAGSASGTLALLAESGAQPTALPGGATVASVLAGLRSLPAFTVTAAALTRGYTPVADGSGAWTWAADAQLALHGTVDASGRVRCEAIESGPLCVTFCCWGPFADDVGAAAHPHLTVRAWYRCWLDGATGAIDRVEHLHALHQGWIGDLAGGSTQAGLQVGDFAVRRGETTVTGLSWTGLRSCHHTMSALTTIASDGTSAAEHTAGSHWTSGAPTLHAAFDRAYWNATGLVGPYDLTLAITNTADASPAAYAPGATAASGKMDSEDRMINGPGAGGEQYLGVIPGWDVAALYTNARSWCRSGLVTALAAGSAVYHLFNPATGRIPVVTSSGVYADTALTRMGPNRNTLDYTGNFSLNSLIKLQARTFGPGGAADHLGTEGGWSDTWDYSHHPSLVYYTYLRTGAPWLLEHQIVDGNQVLMKGSGSNGANRRNTPMPSGATPDGCFILRDQVRAEGWAWRSLAQALAVCPDDRVERPYLQKIYDANAAAAAAEIVAAPAGALALGTWNLYHKLQAGAAGTAGLLEWINNGWMEDFVCAGRVLGRRVHGSGYDAEADDAAFFAHYARFVKGRGGGEADVPCSWQASNYTYCVGRGATIATGYYSWADMPSYGITQGVNFDATTQSTGHVVGRTLRISETEDGFPFQAGDRIMFHPATGSTANVMPPDEVTPGQWYYLAEVNHATHRVLLSPNADLSAPITSFSSTKTGVMTYVRLQGRCPTPTATRNTHYASLTYVPQFLMSLNLLTLVGAIAPDAAWAVAARARAAGLKALGASELAYESDQRWAFAPTEN